MFKKILILSLSAVLFHCATSRYLLSENQKVSIESSILQLENEIQNCRLTLQNHSGNNSAVLKMFDDTVLEWKNYYVQKEGNFDIHLLLSAIEFAAIKHEGQFRKAEIPIPYIIHPIGVAKSIWIEGKIHNTNVLIAALLHDTLEDTETTGMEIENLFGKRVRLTVEELTDDQSLSSEEKKQLQIEHSPQMSLNAQIVKLADRLYNVRDLNNSFSNDKIQRYVAWAKKLLQGLRGTNDYLEAALEKEINNRSS